MQKREVITLCGSSRFKTTFHQVNERLTLQGKIVISMGVWGHFLSEEEQAAKFSPEVKENLDRLHFDKIDMSDSIYVVNVGGYIGFSTGREIDYAKEQGKKIYYLEAASDEK
ncbi:DUF4406 domain-containing protein [Aureispira anguillae]|uniref:DUF4406 domain-containing protein n=1 Tax=Aureispira anguillae TaxID=2864201 RepID=A0A915YGQ0_9BACT|nr:DUF4406 domain-containing protein [Aureispira anguillae]BDS12758.1 DUF4406 domain-containing protein [Aureispira anguillae]